jgi:subtilisin family serine protease
MENQEKGRKTDGDGVFPWGWILVALLVIVLLLFLAFVLAPPSPKLTVDCIEWRSPSEEPLLLDQQIIITGPDDAVTRVKESADVKLTPLRTCEVGYRGGLGTLRTESLPFSSSELRHLAMDLYALEPEQDLADALIRINAAGRAQNVYAHPNYLVGLLGQSSCGNPWEVVGSPWEVVGSPWEVVGSPWEVVGSPWEVVGSLGGPPVPADVAADLFWNQWAFQQIGAGPFFTSTLASTLSTPAGAAVRVGVFDTSPFSEPPTLKAAAEGEWVPSSNQPDWRAQSGEETSLELTTFFSELPPLKTTDPDPPDLSNHGLFVAGLIHAIAPESDIRLYRVLDEHGCGQVFTISEAILHFAEGVQTDADSLRGAVINLSLGVHKPRTVIQDSGLSRAPGAEQAETLEDEVNIRREVLDVLASDPIESLRLAVALAAEKQIVIVAAAGNDSYLASQDGLVLSPHYPALYPSVIGVSASNALRQRSCFSNWGDVAAPGGGGGPGSILAERDPGVFEENPDLRDLDCLPLSSTCSGDCLHALIGLAYNQDTTEYGYVYWQGTSFSAPLVSGAAALVLDAGSAQAGRGQAWLSPDQVFAALRCGTTTPDGVINIPASLYRCLP